MSLALDVSSELVVAGSEDSYEIFLWSLQTGKLLDVLSGHEGPVTSVAFSPSQPGHLASGSWDKTYGPLAIRTARAAFGSTKLTPAVHGILDCWVARGASVKVWDVYGGGRAKETLQHGADVLALAYRPDGNELAVATLDGSIALWDLKTLYACCQTVKARQIQASASCSSFNMPRCGCGWIQAANRDNRGAPRHYRRPVGVGPAHCAQFDRQQGLHVHLLHSGWAVPAGRRRLEIRVHLRRTPSGCSMEAGA